MEPNWKPSGTDRKIAKRKTKRDLERAELDAKGEVRRRDLHKCRFPLCGCRELKLHLDARLEVSHQKHKGAGGNPAGDRSLAEIMILLCLHRHQQGRISIGKGTLRAEYLTALLANGPLRWLADTEVLPPGHYRCTDRENRWFELARESKVQVLEPLTINQEVVLRALATMKL